MASFLCSWLRSRRAGSRARSAMCAVCFASPRRLPARRRLNVAEPLLAVENVSMRFGGLLAVADASLTVREGSITAVIGPNGAGKTTLFALVTGFLTPTAGRVLYRGDDVTGQPAHM